MSGHLIRWDPQHRQWSVIDQATDQTVGEFSKLYEAERFVVALGEPPHAEIDLDIDAGLQR